jgi:pimeloyl-ACP methyl ester carboxylesterase
VPKRPFSIHVDDEVLVDLRHRLDATIWPQVIPDTGWDYGADLATVRDLCRYWAQDFDWRGHEDALNRWPQYLVDIDGFEVHCVHVEGKGPAPLPLVMTHGWPSSFYEMHKVIGPLTDPVTYGGDPADAFHLVVPSLPGYGFSSPPEVTGVDAGRIADVWVELMARFGYARFGSQGGDWGSAVTTALGARHPEHMIGLHFNMLAPPVDEAGLTEEQAAWWEGVKAYRDREWGYVHLQRTKPQTASFALTDSPAGLAAWIVEKWWRWTDIQTPDGSRDLFGPFTRDEILVNVMLYWVTRSIGPSLRLYYETFSPGSRITQPGPITVPTGVALFKDPNRPPRELVEPWYDLRRFTVVDRGGHFPAMENPDDLVAEIRAFFRPLR